MRFIPTKIYGIKDYLAIAFMISAPWLFGYAQGGAETWVMVGVGIAGLIHTLMTRFELGLFKVISMSKHLYMDAGSGVFLIAAPWLFGFAEMGPETWVPVGVGIFEIIVSFCGQRGPREVTDAEAVKTIHPQRVK